jgi:hypothetical protein
MVNECKQDFFIYVPAANDMDVLIHALEAGEMAKDSTRVHSEAPFSDEEWVRISLAGQVIYARLREELEEM